MDEITFVYISRRCKNIGRIMWRRPCNTRAKRRVCGAADWYKKICREFWNRFCCQRNNTTPVHPRAIHDKTSSLSLPAHTWQHCTRPFSFHHFLRRHIWKALQNSNRCHATWRCLKCSSFYIWKNEIGIGMRGRSSHCACKVQTLKSYHTWGSSRGLILWLKLSTVL